MDLSDGIIYFVEKFMQELDIFIFFKEILFFIFLNLKI